MSILDTLLGKDASRTSKEAAALQYSREQQAIEQLLGAGRQYAGDMANLATQFEPYKQAGGSALQQLLGGLGLGGPDASARFTEAYRALPGYQSGLDTGINAVNNTAASRGMLNSGRTMKDLYRFGSDYEDARSGDYLTRLMGLAGTGQQATAQGVATEGEGLTGKLGADKLALGSSFKSAATVPQGMVAGASAEASGVQNLLNFGGNIFGRLMGFA